MFIRNVTNIGRLSLYLTASARSGKQGFSRHILPRKLSPVFQFLLVFTESRPIHSRNFFYKHLNLTTMSYEKIYFGKGRQVPNMQVAKVTIALEKLQEIAYEKEGVMYCSFEVSKMKEADRFGREYTAYYSKMMWKVNEPAPEIPKKKTGRPQKKKAGTADELNYRSKLKS
jgi:hypothetical protein